MTKVRTNIEGLKNIKAGKKYTVRPHIMGGSLGIITNEAGRDIIIKVRPDRFGGCAHLNGGEWEVIEDKPDSYKNSSSSETININKVSKPFNVIDGKIVEIK